MLLRPLPCPQSRDLCGIPSIIPIMVVSGLMLKRLSGLAVLAAAFQASFNVPLLGHSCSKLGLYTTGSNPYSLPPA